MRTRGWISVAVLATVLAACGGSSKKDARSGGSNGTGAASGDDSKSGNSDFDKLVAKAKDANVKISYKSGTSSDAFTIIQYHGDSGFVNGDSEYLTTGGKTYSCSSLKSTPECTAVPSVAGTNPAGSMMTAFFGAYAGLLQNTGSFHSLFGSVSSNTSSETIAGRDAKCVKVTGSALGQSGSYTVCVDKETGFLLKGETEANGAAASSIEATSYAESSADDVKLPAQPTTIST